jgi:methylmalonyl-CoA carboxyltransferase 12S subunit
VSTAIEEPVTPQPTLDDLLRRVEQLEAELAEVRAALPPRQAIPGDVVLAISAAVAAFLGERATVRQIHLAGDTAWAREGRSYVQSTHSSAARRR